MIDPTSRLLRSYINELRQDDRFIAMLAGAGLGHHHREAVNIEAEELAEGWIDDVEVVTGRPVSPGIRSQVIRFVEGRMSGLVVLFRGNKNAARMTMYNLMDAKFSDLKSAI